MLSTPATDEMRAFRPLPSPPPTSHGLTHCLAPAAATVVWLDAVDDGDFTPHRTLSTGIARDLTLFISAGFTPG